MPSGDVLRVGKLRSRSAATRLSGPKGGGQHYNVSMKTTDSPRDAALRKAKEPFHFRTRSHLAELTGLKAKSLRELLACLKSAPDGVVYYHTHHFLAEHHYLTPEPPNDFAGWVTEVLRDDILGEQLASVDTFNFSTLASLRDRLANIIEEHLGGHGDHVIEAPPGSEFFFIKSVSVVMGTAYRAYDLREFVEALRKVTVGSLYFHMFEARLRLGRGQNDFSTWFESGLDEKDLAHEVAGLDPYNFSLEGLRSALTRLIENRLT